MRDKAETVFQMWEISILTNNLHVIPYKTGGSVCSLVKNNVVMFLKRVLITEKDT